MTQTADRLTDLFELARKKDWKKLDAAWVDNLGDPITDPKFYAHLGQSLIKSKQINRLEEMTQLVVTQLNDDGKHLEAVRILRTVLRMVPNSTGLREPLLTALRAEYADRPLLEDYIRASKLEEEGHLGSRLLLFEQMMTTAVGSVFRHKTWGLGQVTEQQVDGDKVTLDFGDQGTKTFSFGGVREFLDRIPPSNLLAQTVTDPEGLANEAKENPVDVVKRALGSGGRTIRQTDLKTIFVPLVFTNAQWSRWWTMAKDKLRMDPFIEVGLGTNAEISLRESARRPEEELTKRLEAAETHNARHQAVREAVRFLKSGAIEPAALAEFANQMKAGYDESGDGATKLTWALFAEELNRAVDGESPIWNPDIAEVFEAVGDGVDLVSGLALGDHKMRALEMIKAHSQVKFGEVCVALIDESPMTVAKWMMRELLAEESLHQSAIDALGQLLLDPGNHPEAYMWAMRQVMGGPWAHLSVDNDATSILARTLDFLETLQRRIDREDPQTAALRGLATRIRNTLEENHHELMVHTFRDLTSEAAKALYGRMAKMTALSDAWKGAATASLQMVRSDLTAHTSKEDAEMHLVTEASLKEKRAEMQRIRTVDIPANSKDIEIARAHGDLSENAEYKAAKERQVILHRRAEELQRLIEQARPIVPSAITCEVVAPGTTITVVNHSEDDAEERYSLLGMWDADPDKGIIFYKAPFAEQFLRKRQGDRLTVSLPSGEQKDYEILKIEKAV